MLFLTCKMCSNKLISLSKIFNKSLPYRMSSNIMRFESANYSSGPRGRDPHKRSLLAERRPDYDLEGSGYPTEGEWLVKPRLGQMIEVEEVRDRKTWQYVQRLMPRKTIPDVPKHDSYPTPSGWFPPYPEIYQQYPYKVERSKYHNFPIYLKYTHVGTKAVTEIRRIEGDIWTLEADLRQFLEKHNTHRPDWPVLIQVDEICKILRVRGKYLEEVAEFLTERGM